MATLTHEELENHVLEALVEFGAERDDLQRDATLESLDIDSLDMVELGQALQEDLGIKLAPKDFEGVKTVGDALDVITARAGVS